MQLQIAKHKLIIRSLLDLWFRQNTIFIASSSGTAVDERIVCDAFTNCHWNLFLCSAIGHIIYLAIGLNSNL